MISCISSIASSAPATSSNVTVGDSFETSFARDLPNCMTLLPPPWALESRNQNSTPSRSSGSMSERKPSNHVGRGTASLKPSAGSAALIASTTSLARAVT